MSEDTTAASNDPESYTDIYMRKYTGASKKPSLEKRTVVPQEYNKSDIVNMNKDNKEDEKPEPAKFSEKPRTVVSVHPDDTSEELGYSADDVKPEASPTTDTTPIEALNDYMDEQFLEDDVTEKEPLKAKLDSTTSELNKLKTALTKKAFAKRSKLHKKDFNFFTLLIGFCAFSVAGCAAFFSVKGIALLFSGALVGVLIMASSLEVAKLVTASFLYRYWGKLSYLLRFYLTTAVILLIGITSLGIFGYLSDAFETTKNKVSNYESQITKLEGDIEFNSKRINSLRTAKDVVDERSDAAVTDYKVIYDEFVSRKENEKELLRSRITELDAIVTNVSNEPGGLFSSKKKKLSELTESQRVEREVISQNITTIATAIESEYKVFLGKVNTYKNNITSDKSDDRVVIDTLNKEVQQKRDSILSLNEDIRATDIGSFKFIARAFGAELEDVVKYFILILVLVFDPHEFANALTGS